MCDGCCTSWTAHVRALMAEESIGDMPVSIQYSADVWYIGQSYHLEVPLDADAADPLGKLYRDFLALHDRIYGHATEQPAAIVNLRAVHRAGGSDHLDEGDYRPLDADPRKPPRAIRVAGAACAGPGGDLSSRRDAGRPDVRRSRDRGTGRHDHAGRTWLARHRTGQRQSSADARLTWTSIRSRSKCCATSSTASPTRCSSRWCAARSPPS